MPVTLIPEVVTVVKTAEVVIKLSLHQAHLIMALVGKCNEGHIAFGELYRELDDTIGFNEQYSEIIRKGIQDYRTKYNVINLTESYSELLELMQNT